MKYVVLRVPTNSEGQTVPAVIGTYTSRLVAESHFYDEVADAASKVNGSGRLLDGAYLFTDGGEFLDSKFYTPEASS